MAGSFAWHSQITAHRQLRFFRSLTVSRSRWAFRRSFFVQYSALVLGILAPLQFRCECQKQPFTNSAVLHRVKVKSGLPGRSTRCKLNRRPRACAALLTFISGVVSLDFTCAIVQDRWDRSSFALGDLERLAILGPPSAIRFACAHGLVDWLYSPSL